MAYNSQASADPLTLPISEREFIERIGAELGVKKVFIPPILLSIFDFLLYCIPPLLDNYFGSSPIGMESRARISLIEVAGNYLTTLDPWRES